MTKVYNSSDTNKTEAAQPGMEGSAEAGRKGGATMSARSNEETPAPINDYTGTTSEKSPARYLVPLIIAFIVIGCFLALSGRFTPGTGGQNGTGINAGAGSTTEHTGAQTGAPSAR